MTDTFVDPDNVRCPNCGHLMSAINWEMYGEGGYDIECGVCEWQFRASCCVRTFYTSPPMLHKTTISVRQEHIDRGYADDCQRCPIALATLEILNPECGIQVGLDGGMRITLGEDFWFGTLPDEADDFIAAFDEPEDDDALPEPFEFEMPIPERFLLGNR